MQSFDTNQGSCFQTGLFRGLILFVVCLAMVRLSAVTCQAQQENSPAESSPITAEVKSSEKPRLVDVTPEVAKEIEGIFRQLLDSWRDGQMEKVKERFQARELANFAIQRGVLEIEDNIVEDFLNQMDRVNDQMLEGLTVYVTGDEVQIPIIAKGELDSIKLICRAWDDVEESTMTTQWWFKQIDEVWMVVDIEESGLGLRSTTALGIGASAAGGENGWLKDVRVVVMVMQGIPIPDDVLDNALDELLEAELPNEIRSIALLWDVARKMDAEEYEAALPQLKELEKVDPELAYLHFFRGSVLLELERFSEAIDSLQLYQRQLSLDTETCELLSDCYRNLKDREQAVAYAIKGLEMHPTAWGCLASLSVALPEKEKARVDPWFAKIDFDEGALEMSVEWAVEVEDWAAASHVFKLLCAKHPDSEAIEYLKEYFEH